METFVRIAKAGSMARAANQMGVSRAIVSTHLTQLEAHLGARLFNRTTRKLVLTEIGTEYFTFANRVLAEIDDMEVSVARTHMQPRGALKIACPLIFGHFLLAAMVTDFLKANPEITATIVLYDARLPLVHMLENGFDVVIQLGRVQDMSISARSIGSIRYIACAARDYLDKYGSPETPEDLVKHNCLVHQIRTPDSIWPILKNGEVVQVKVSGSLLGNSDSVLRAGVCNGLGITILPEYSITRHLENGSVVRILPDCEMPAREITALLPHNRQIPNKTRVLLDYLSKRLTRI